MTGDAPAEARRISYLLLRSMPLGCAHKGPSTNAVGKQTYNMPPYRQMCMGVRVHVVWAAELGESSRPDSNYSDAMRESHSPCTTTVFPARAPDVRLTHTTFPNE